MASDINKISDDDVHDFSLLLAPGNSLDEYQRIATKTAIYPGRGTPLGLNYVALKGAGEAGEFAEHVGKAMRDDGLMVIADIDIDNTATVEFHELTSDRKEKLIREVGDQLWYLAAKCNELGISLSQAALINLEKLCSRSVRGKLGGSGDDR